MTRPRVPLIWMSALALCLSLASLPGRAAPQAGFTSAYTDLNTQCRLVRAASKGGDAPMRCAGPDGYRLLVSFSAWAADLFVESRDQRFSRLVAAGQAAGYARQKGRKIEWRIANGKPFAVIARAFEYASGDDGAPDFSRSVDEKLIVKGLAGFEHIDFAVDARTTPNANVRARQLADESYQR
ncbi:MAG: hypothetical protein CFK52_03425 [Chloracidobacterium sp. CP2_5A]|nr:MAG: hypothetical protein CFK52_03425 [Chloracidobacterium sp. CP2_5A]